MLSKQRLPDIYGPNDKRSKILNLIKNTARKETLLKMSPGEQELDLVFIDDIVEGFIQSSKVVEQTEQYFNVYALSSRKPIKLKEIAKLFESVNDTKVNIEWGALDYRENEIMKVNIPNNILPAWESKIPLEVGLKMIW